MMKCWVLIIFSFFQCLFGQEVIDWIDLDLLKSKNVQAVKVWKVNAFDKEDQAVHESIYFNRDFQIDSVIEYKYQKSLLATVLKSFYLHNEDGSIKEIQLNKNGTPSLFYKHYYEGGKLARIVDFSPSKSFDYSESYLYYPDGTLSKKVENHVKEKYMKAYFYKYNAQKKIEKVVVRIDKTMLETHEYHYGEEGAVSIQYFDRNNEQIKTVAEKHNDLGQITYYEAIEENSYVRWEFEFYQNDLIKIMKKYHSKEAINQYYYELEYQFFE